MTTPANYIVPPVQPIQQPKINLPGQGGQGQPQQPGQEQPGGQGQDESTVHHLMILIGALTEALVANGILSEEDIHNAISRLEIGGDEDGEEEEDEEDEEGKEPQANRSQPNPKSSGSHGYPGAADTEKGMGNEWGKNQR